jgi:hypothetical protein
MKLFNQIASCVAAKQAIYLASIIDKVMQDCFLLFHSIALSLNMKAYPEVDLDWSASLPQSASE